MATQQYNSYEIKNKGVFASLLVDDNEVCHIDIEIKMKVSSVSEI